MDKITSGGLDLAEQVIAVNAASAGWADGDAQGS